MSQPLFEVDGLTVAVFDADRYAHGVDEGLIHAPSKRALGDGWAIAIDTISFSVARGEVLAIVGESGSGKTLSALGSLGLNSPGSMVIDGAVSLLGRRLDVFASPEERGRKDTRRERRRWRKRARSYMGDALDDEYRSLMGNHVGVMFQDPISGWSPTEMIGEQTGEALAEHTELSDDEIRRRVFDALGEVKLPKRAGSAFAFELSRGQAQRAMLAAALIKAPDLLVADEPLTGLDPPVAATVLELMNDMRAKRGLAMILITHDLSTVARIADRVAVMYGGRIVEQGPVREIFHHPQHPYTSGLLGSIPWAGSERLRPIPGSPPKLIDITRGECSFAPRCAHAEPRCVAAQPPVTMVGPTATTCIRAVELDFEGIPQ